jgi:nucleotide-binding universal stress UspA family protein
MFKHILVPTDLTEKSLKALSVAVGMAERGESRITLLHVIETIEDSESGEFSDFYERLARRARKRMEQMLGPYEGEEVIVENEILYGKRLAEIIRFSRDREIDLIVVSSHRIEPGDLNIGWGTISYKVSILSQCPVLLVK